MLSALSIQGSSDSLNAEIREILGLNFPISSFDLDLADLRNRVLSLPLWKPRKFVWRVAVFCM